MAINKERRKAVMSRSMKLGHCVCNPKLPCPCPVFKEHNVCQCAGERLPVKTGAIALTRHVRKAGCASKIGQADLNRILSKLPVVDDPRVLVGATAGDDAGIFKIDDDHALVQTVDVFSPCVDDPYLFGQIAAANSLSDVYAMGGKPLTALSVVGFPIEELDGKYMQDMLRGGMDKLAEANCPCVGGHSINDEEIKCGFAITGMIDTNKVVERGRAKVDDVLVLTKPIGTGIVAFGAQIKRIDEQSLSEVGASMAELNKDAAELMVKHDASACTDVTGFGLAGHLLEMCRTSNTDVEIDLSTLPVFAAVKSCVEMDIFSGAIESNQEYSKSRVRVKGQSEGNKASEGNEKPGADKKDGDSKKNVTVLYDPQTSGGLLISMPEEKAGAFVSDMKKAGHESTSIIGRMLEKRNAKNDSTLFVVNPRFENLVGKGRALDKADPEREAEVRKKEMATAPAASQMPDVQPCCDNPPEIDAAVPDSPDALPLFMDFMHKASAEGKVDTRAKKLIWVALSVGFRCEACLASHLKGAVEMGISKEEIEEAACVGIAFGGCSAMLLYREMCKKLKI